MRHPLLLLALSLPVVTMAQRDTTVTDYFRLTFEDDYFKAFFRHAGSIDRYYTSGLKLEYYSESPRRNFIENGMPFSGTFTSKAFTLGLGCNMYTPADLYLSRVDSTDRPYAGYLYASARGTYNTKLKDKARRITVEYSLGVLGPPALQAEVQKGFHRLIDKGIPSADPKGWDNQISAALALNANFKFEPSWIASRGLDQRVARGKAIIELFPTTEVNVGTVMDYVRGGMMFSLQTGGGRSYFASEFTHNPITPNLVRVEEVARVREKRFVFTFYVKPSVTLLAYNSTLSGGLLSFERSRYVLTSDRIQYIYGQVDAGLMVKTRPFALVYSNTYRSPEFKGALSSLWGSISILVFFKHRVRN